MLLAPLLLLCQVPAARVELDLACRTIERFEQRLDAYLPEGAGPHPALLLVHGGSWMHGDKRDMREFGEAFAREGYACFSVSYRLAPAYRWPAQLDDCQYALQFVRANAARFQLDPARIGALGLSAGGHLVALLGTLDERRDEHAADPVLRESSRVQCVVDYFGPVLLARVRARGFDTLPPAALFGDAPDSAYAAASPLELVTHDDAPFLLVHGEADELVPLQHSKAMDEALRAAGVESELVPVAGGGHGDFFRTDPHGAYWQKTEAFLARHLAPAPAGAAPSAR